MFNRKFFLYSFLIFSSLYGLIVAVDPYDKYGFNPFQFTSKAVMQGRDSKFRMVENSKNEYQLYLLGSSSAHRFRVEDLNHFSGLISFNYALQHTTPEDYYAIIGHIFSKSIPKLILLQMDFYALDANFEVDNRLYNSQLKAYLKGTPSNKYFADAGALSTYLTLDAIRDTLKVIGVNLFGRALSEYEANGDYPIEPRPKGDKVQLSQSGYGNYKLSQSRIELLKEIKQICDKNGTQIIVFTAPHTAEHLAEISRQGVDKQFIQFKQALVNVFGEVYDFANESSQLISTHDYFMDSSHASPYLSKLILQKIFTGSSHIKSDQFGIKLQ